MYLKLEANHIVWNGRFWQKALTATQSMRGMHSKRNGGQNIVHGRAFQRLYMQGHGIKLPAGTEVAESRV